ncbi:transcriptional regulator [Streptomyces sp. SID7982]|nr:tetratricopeptide (TPR) repeat protein [Streptomyces sp. DSM 41037]NEE40000.1 transcriptional regulator [Streptomyces sp. SID7982]
MSELPHSPELPAGLLTDPAMIDACRRRDFGAVFRLVKARAGVYPSMIARRCDLTPSRVGEVMAGRRQLVHMDVVERIADGLRIPGHLFGLARRGWETAPSQAVGEQQPGAPVGAGGTLSTAASLDGLAGPSSGRSGRLELPRDVENFAKWQQPNGPALGVGPWHRWGSELRQYRQAKRLSQQALACVTLIDRSHIGRFERAERPVPRHAAIAFDEALGCAGKLVRSWEEARHDPCQGATGAGGEAPGCGASACGPGASTPASLVTDGQGQAGSGEDGTDIVVAPARVHGRIVLVPVPRRIVLAAGLFGFAAAAVPLPAAASVPPADMLSPVEHFTHLRRAMIQTDNLIGPRNVLPALQQHLTSLAARRRAARGADAAELLALETRYEELAGWLAQDIGDERTAQGHTARALDASHATGDTDLTAYILGRKAQLALDTGHPADALGMAAAARRTAHPGSRLEVIAVLHEAHAHAVLGDAASTHRTYETALSLLERAEGDGVWGSWLDVPYINTARARSLAALGAYEEAAAGFSSALSTLPTAYRRDRGVYLARGARAHAGAGDLPLAAKLGGQAVGIAVETGSARIVEQLGHLDQVLATAPGEEGITEFRAALDRIVLHPV